MSAILTIDNQNLNIGFPFLQNNTETFSPKNEIPTKVFLFMIGGSGASVIEPAIFYFSEYARKINCRIIPIFIDRNFDSQIVFRSINSIQAYKKYCTLSSLKPITTSPFLFIDNDYLFTESNLSQIINKISPEDIVVFSYSLSNKRNIEVVECINRLISTSKISLSKVFHLNFLPYFKLTDFEDDLIFDDNRDSSFNIDNIRSNLQYLTSIDKENPHFIAGLDNLSRYSASKIQRNPFNVVSLILAYALMSLLSKDISGNKFYTYRINLKDEYGLEDLIPNSNIRSLVVKNDLKSLCWDFICRSKAFSQYGELIKKEDLEEISAYFTNSTDILFQLTDKTIHRQVPIRIRKEVLASKNIWEHFRRKQFPGIRIPHTEKSFLDELLSYSDMPKLHLNNKDQVIAHTLKSIDRFIEKEWDTISPLYF